MQDQLLQWCKEMAPALAALLILAGVIYLLFGYYMFRVLVMLNAALVGAFFGATIGHNLGSWSIGAIIGGFSAAAASLPMMKHAIAIFGATLGVILGASMWLLGGLEPHLAWAGAAMGLIFLGMLSFILFRGSIIMFTSLQGGIMLVFGVLGLLFRSDMGPHLTDGMLKERLLLPMCIFIASVIGLLYQQTHHPAQTPGKK